jgi:hypothetical protein
MYFYMWSVITESQKVIRLCSYKYVLWNVNKHTVHKPTPTLKVKAESSSETFLSSYKTTRRYDAEYYNQILLKDLNHIQKL